ncbi:tyrosine-type recombinase/integrase [Lentzea kentuckyensis]|uniref:tyrosine-type recombinase/integrase n=1 Tax=Lentzea kentuckyensis TaxID=360086 RepID=UPI000A380336|nr:tyrosine-type recombinase/integrase [Lentzea kentuckyensis]
MAWVEKSGKQSWRVRYFNDDGTIGSLTGFTTKTAADNAAEDLESDQRDASKTELNPGQTTTLAEWAKTWLDALDVDLRTEENYRSKLRARILPRWGTTPLADIKNAAAHAWAKTLRQDGLADVTVSDTLKLLSFILSDAHDEKLIPANPIRPRRRGRARRHRQATEQIWAMPGEVIRVADQAATCYGPAGGMLILTGGWTGARWGELVGLQRQNLHLDDACFVIDPNFGSLHESASGKLWLGPPKTPQSARTVTLPEFLVPLLRQHLDTHDHRHVFITPGGDLHRRSNFSRRAMRPASDGNSGLGTYPIKPGLTFRGLRHSHKTWMIADAVPEVAQSRRLGHKLPDKIQETYSHVAAEVEQRLMIALQKRWIDAITELREHEASDWRTAA